MRDPNMKNFQGRLRRIESIHRSGGGFEAAGTLGHSYYTNLKRRRGASRWILPLALVLGAVILVKGAVHAQIGAATYDSRIETMRAGDTADRIGAYVLQADPLTLFVSDFFRTFH
ncbi:hypothetical protein [Ostreiculturibacter nitratireducens]|uniref:hypothetical protein n=1 Tax=Ostreiculturibacter nitratireducens TaxID=3075226 RepID=UPI0031B63098